MSCSYERGRNGTEKEAFDINWVVPLGPNVNGFEKDLEEFVGEEKRVVALSAGTAAVHKGNCLDNAMMENFFGLMKSELLYSGKYTSADTFIKDLVEYIEYYNNERIKLRLNGMSPVQYRKMLTASIV